MPNCKAFASPRGLEEPLRNCHLDNEAVESGQGFLIVPVPLHENQFLGKLTWHVSRGTINLKLNFASG
jgi:hypothetical protein